MYVFVFFFKQKTAYEMRISDWSSDVCSSDLLAPAPGHPAPFVKLFLEIWEPRADLRRLYPLTTTLSRVRYLRWLIAGGLEEYGVELAALPAGVRRHPMFQLAEMSVRRHRRPPPRSEAHTAELPSIMRISYAVLCL